MAKEFFEIKTRVQPKFHFPAPEGMCKVPTKMFEVWLDEEGLYFVRAAIVMHERPLGMATVAIDAIHALLEIVAAVQDDCVIYEPIEPKPARKVKKKPARKPKK